jgi:hypothetical protein
MGPFEKYQSKTPPDGLAPTALTRGDWPKFLRALGAFKDALAARARAAVKESFPDACPVDALPRLGADLVLERGLAETDLSFRTRLRNALDAWRWAGTERGLLMHVLSPMGFTNCAVIRNRDWARLGADGVPPDGDAAAWHRFWLVLATPHGWTPEGVWADDSEWNESEAGGDLDPAITIDASNNEVQFTAVPSAHGSDGWRGYLPVGAYTTPAALMVALEAGLGTALDMTFEASEFVIDGGGTVSATMDEDGLVTVVLGGLDAASPATLRWSTNAVTRALGTLLGFGEANAAAVADGDGFATFTATTPIPLTLPGTGPGVWGSDSTPADYEQIKRLVRTWSPAHAYCVGVFIVEGDGLTPDAIPTAAPWREPDLQFDGQHCLFWRF